MICSRTEGMIDKIWRSRGEDRSGKLKMEQEKGWREGGGKQEEGEDEKTGEGGREGEDEREKQRGKERGLIQSR